MRKIHLSNLFHDAVERHGSQMAVARKCGISQSLVSLLLSGKLRTIKSSNIPKIAHCLGVKPAVLLAACAQSASIAPCKFIQH